MRVALINPAFTKYGGIVGHGGNCVPLNLLYIAAYIRGIAEVAIFDAEAEGWTHLETVEVIEAFRPDVIGMTANTCVFDSVIELSKLLRPLGARIVAGGPHVSALPELSLRQAELDAVIVGEGEATFRKILGGEIKGIYQGEPFECLDYLPFPARDLIDNNRYYAPATKRVRNSPHTLIATSRGCPYNCGFCAAHTVWGRSFRARSARSVVSELTECIDRFSIRSFHFTDELFTADKDRVTAICARILSYDLDISWVCSARAQGLDYKLLKLMKRAGCNEISYGIESGNQDMLKRIDKALNLDEAIKVIKATQKAGITTHASYMFGYLGENVFTMDDTLAFATKLNTDIAAFFVASPLPGTRLYKETLAKGYIRRDAKWIDYSPLSNKMPVIDTPWLASDTVKDFHRKALREYYFRWRYVFARLLRLRHWYEIVNIWRGILLFLRIK